MAYKRRGGGDHLEIEKETEVEKESNKKTNNFPSQSALPWGGWGANLSAIVNTCVQASSRSFTWRLEEAQHQIFMDPGEQKEVFL